MQFSALLIASGLALLALAYVLYPLYRGRLVKTVPASPPSTKNVQSSPSDSEQAARLSLQEVELDYQLGNITEADYRTLRERYMRHALVAMKSRYDTAPTDTEHQENENEQDRQDTDIDALIEEQLRKMREQLDKENDGNGGNDDE